MKTWVMTALLLAVSLLPSRSRSEGAGTDGAPVWVWSGGGKGPLSGAEYDPTTRVLRVRFTGGRDYLYYDVPPWCFTGFVRAPGKVAFFDRCIRSRYHMLRVDAGRSAAAAAERHTRAKKPARSDSGEAGAARGASDQA